MTREEELQRCFDHMREYLEILTPEQRDRIIQAPRLLAGGWGRQYGQMEGPCLVQAAEHIGVGDRMDGGPAQQLLMRHAVARWRASGVWRSFDDACFLIGDQAVAAWLKEECAKLNRSRWSDIRAMITKPVQSVGAAVSVALAFMFQ